jgi:predicted PolB exonuclease-like 3'-5' exonuclease
VKDDDIEAIINASKHFKYHEPTGSTPFNRISKLPESKRHLKMGIKERIKLLVASYISLASFIDDDLVDFLESGDTKNHKRKVIRIYNKVFRDFEKLRKEISSFDPFDVPKE